MTDPRTSPRPGRLKQLWNWLTAWRFIRRALLTMVVFATLVATFYTVENWRGRRAWERCKRELVAAGFELDWNKFIPPPIPDGQNIFKAPHMEEWFVKSNTVPGGEISRVLVQRLSNTNTTVTITNRQVAQSYLAWSDEHAAEFEAIRVALQRPQARIDCDYRDPYKIAIPNFVNLRVVAQVLAQRARCHLLLGEPAEAARDLSLIFETRRLMETRPLTLVAAMINVAITGLYMEVVSEGIQQQAWTETELKQLEPQLNQIKLTPLMLAAFRMGLTATSHSWHENPRPLLEFWRSSNENSGWKRYANPTFWFAHFAPRGWFDQNLVVFSSYLKRITEVCVSQGRYFEPAKQESIFSELTSLPQPHYNPFAILANIGIPNSLKASQTAARAQAKADQALIVLALEKFRQVNGQFPTALAALKPQFLAEIPGDVINGQPLHYRRVDNDSFLLYSVGWNETDDGGKTASSITEGDWVWRYRWE